MARLGACRTAMLARASTCSCSSLDTTAALCMGSLLGVAGKILAVWAPITLQLVPAKAAAMASAAARRMRTCVMYL
eukprot:4883197-Pyramimonas_sp.AAC.1